LTIFQDLSLQFKNLKPIENELPRRLGLLHDNIRDTNEINIRDIVEVPSFSKKLCQGSKASCGLWLPEREHHTACTAIAKEAAHSIFEKAAQQGTSNALFELLPVGKLTKVDRRVGTLFPLFSACLYEPNKDGYAGPKRCGPLRCDHLNIYPGSPRTRGVRIELVYRCHSIPSSNTAAA
jgi:hypothetical protein